VPVKFPVEVKVATEDAEDVPVIAVPVLLEVQVTVDDVVFTVFNVTDEDEESAKVEGVREPA